MIRIAGHCYTGLASTVSTDSVVVQVDDITKLQDQLVQAQAQIREQHLALKAAQEVAPAPPAAPHSRDLPDRHAPRGVEDTAHAPWPRRGRGGPGRRRTRTHFRLGRVWRHGLPNASRLPSRPAACAPKSRSSGRSARAARRVAANMLPLKRCCRARGCPCPRDNRSLPIELNIHRRERGDGGGSGGRGDGGGFGRGRPSRRQRHT